MARRRLIGEELTSLGVVNGVIQDDWDKIIKIAQAGKASKFYGVGNRKALSFGSYGSTDMILAGIDVDERADGEGYANTTWIPVRPVKMTHFLFSSWSNDLITYEESQIRFFAEGMAILMPDLVRKNITRIKKTWVSSNKVDQEILCDVWIPSIRELRSSNSNREKTGPIYPSIPFATDGMSIWTRSAYDGTKGWRFYHSSVKSEFSNAPYENEYAVLPCFCI